MDNVEEVVSKFLELSPYDVANSDAIDKYLETKEYISINDESIFGLAMKIIYENYR